MPGRSAGNGRDRIGAHLEGPKVEIAGGPRRAPARIFAARRDDADLGLDLPVAKRRHAHRKPVADLEALDEILAQVEAQPDVVKIDEREQRHAGRDIFAELRADLVDLRRDRRLDRQFVDSRLDRVDRGLRLDHIGAGDGALLFRVAGDGLLIGELRLIRAALRDLQRVGRLVEPLQRRVAGSGQLLDAVIGLLRELEIGVGAVERGLLLRDHFGARARQDIGELGLGDAERGLGLAQLGHQFGIVDLVKQLSGGDIIAALDRALRDAAIDARRDVDAGRVGLALDHAAAAAGRDTRATGRRSRR